MGGFLELVGLLRDLLVVLLAGDLLALLVLGVLDALAFLLRHLAVGHRLVFLLLDLLLALFQALRFLAQVSGKQQLQPTANAKSKRARCHATPRHPGL